MSLSALTQCLLVHTSCGRYDEPCIAVTSDAALCCSGVCCGKLAQRCLLPTWCLPARCSCKVLIWAASPSRLPAYSFWLAVPIACTDQTINCPSSVCLGSFAFISESNVSQVEFLFACVLPGRPDIVIPSAKQLLMKFGRHWEPCIADHSSAVPPCFDVLR